MKTGILTTKTIASDDIQGNKSIMGMSSKGMDMAAYFMRDKIYSDKILAVVREYISNADDEHRRHNIDCDVVVSTKHVNGQYVWAVRDYALGLSESDIRNIFGMYFESTKSQCNESIGGFGIGSKSAFSYTDTFYVTSYHEGVKTLYACTLGAGDRGIPVGEIYAVSKEPTTEQGIEVSLELKATDVNTFHRHTEILVRRMREGTRIVYNAYSGHQFVPMTPKASGNMGDYILNAYDSSFPYSTEKKLEIRMGGIVYPYSRNTFYNKFDWSPADGTIVVDVPIGKLTLPISREAIESTPLNNKVIEEIISLVIKERNAEAATQTVPKFGELMAQDFYTSNIKNFTGKFFKHDFRSMFPATASFQQVVIKRLSGEEDYSNGSQVFSKKATHIIHITPNIKSVRPWYRRLKLGLSELQGDKYEGYMTISQKHYDELLALPAADLATIDTSDCVFIDVKGLKLPKLATTAQGEFTDRKFVTYFPNNYSKNYLTISDIEQNCNELYFNKQDAPDDWADKADSIEKLNRRTITHKTLGLGCWSVGSQKLIEELVNNGWLEYQSVDYNAQRDRIIKLQEELAHKRNAAQELTKYLYGATPSKHLVEAVRSNKDRLLKLIGLRDKLMGEDTTRGKVMRMVLRTHYYSDVKITREDIRKILKLK